MTPFLNQCTDKQIGEVYRYLIKISAPRITCFIIDTVKKIVQGLLVILFLPPPPPLRRAVDLSLHEPPCEKYSSGVAAVIRKVEFVSAYRVLLPSMQNFLTEKVAQAGMVKDQVKTGLKVITAKAADYQNTTLDTLRFYITHTRNEVGFPLQLMPQQCSYPI